MTMALVLQETAHFKKITIDELNNLGYEITGRQLAIGKKPIKYALMEVRNEDRITPVGFCYVFSIEDNTGVILAKDFNYYISNPDQLFNK